MINAIKKFFGLPRAMTFEEIEMLRELTRLCNQERFKAAQVEGNTARIREGRKYAEQLKQSAEIYDGVRSSHISQLLVNLGYPPGTRANIELRTGKVFVLRPLRATEEAVAGDIEKNGAKI